MEVSFAIPDDLAACQALIAEMAKTIDEQQQSVTHLTQQLEERDLRINQLMQAAYGKRSERYLGHPDQLRIDFGDTPGAADAAEGLKDAIEESEPIVITYTRCPRRPKKTRNEQLPEHLPRYEVVVEAPDDVKHCEQHGERQLIGHDRVETLEFERPKLRVRVTLFPKYACVNQPDCGLSQPPRPAGLVEGNRYDTSIAAEIITAKYGYHLPIYRQQDWFGSSGWTPARSTLLNILRASAGVLDPFAQYLQNEVLCSGLVGTDDTRVTLLLPPEIAAAVAGDPKSERIHEVLTKAREKGRSSVNARMWAYRSLTVPINVFDFTVSRQREGPDEFLLGNNFTGTIMADCYSGYQGIPLRSDARIERAACVAHARRKVFDARETYPLESTVLLAMFQELYDIEDRAKRFTAEQRQELRRQESLPVWDRMREWLDSPAAQAVLPKSSFGESLGYLNNQWEALQVYLNDGRLPIDNNDVEQLMKQIAVGRKNWLFIGSVEAGERAADLITIMSSALRNDLDAWYYIKDVLDQLLAGSTDYESLRPDNWKAAHPEHVRTYRVEERRDRADAKQARRARQRASK